MKRLLSVLLSLVVLLAGSASVLAAENTSVEAPVYELNSNSTDAISSRLSYLTSVFTDLTFTDSGSAICQGNYTIFKQNKVTLSVMLQRSTVNTTDDSYWSSVPGASWSQSWSTMGAHMIQKTVNGLANGYYYRVRTSATVYSSSGAMLETVVVKSAVSYH